MNIKLSPRCKSLRKLLNLQYNYSIRNFTSMCKDNKENLKKTNPFFEAYKTPHDTVPFDRIKLEHYEEAFMEGIRRDDEEIEIGRAHV